MADHSMLLTQAVIPTLVSTNSCVLEVRKKYEVIPSVACSLCFILGIVYCFFGYRCLKFVMFLSGLVFGSGIGYLLCLREQLLDSPLDAETRAGISLGIGLLGGLVSILVRCVGLFLTGLHMGLLLSITAMLAAGQFYPVLSPVWVPAGTVFGTGVFFAVLTLCWQKSMTVAATGTLGAAIIVTCLDYCMKTPMLVWRAYIRLQKNQENMLCWYSWLMLGIWIVVAALGNLVQYKYTTKGTSHTEVTGKQKQLHLMKFRQTNTRQLPAGKYRRRPPLLKRYAGDVLAPSYLANLRERQMSTGSSVSSLSTVYHTMIDFDFETGSMVPLTTSVPTVIRV